MLTPEPPNAAVRLRNVSFRYPNTPAPVLEGLDVALPLGHITAIVGPSGCGKTTLLHLIASLLDPTEGTVEYVGAESPRIGYVFQTPALLPWYTVEQNLQLAASLVDRSEPGRRSWGTAREWIQSTGLAGSEHLYPAQLSQGMCQRAAIGMTMLGSPDLLLLDEPFGALDALTREFMDLLLIEGWKERRATGVMVTHDIEEAVFVATRVLLLSSPPARVVGDWPVDLPAPRHPVETKGCQAFGELVRSIRHVLYDEPALAVSERTKQ